MPSFLQNILALPAKTKALLGVSAVAILAIAAFAVSRERRSFVVAGLLAASGLVGVVYALIRTDFLMASSFPGPIFGIILGLPILGLAVAEAVGATRDRRSYK